MYHIPKDERSYKSAEKIYQSLRHILFTKNLEDVTVTDIKNECNVSRSIFYRLFDNVNDVLSMKLKFFVDEYFNISEKSDDKLLTFFNYWGKHSELIYLLSNQAESILRNELKNRLEPDKVENVYYLEAQASLFSSLLCKWVERKKKESIFEMCTICKKIFPHHQNILILK